MTVKLLLAAGALLVSTSAYAQSATTSDQTADDLVCQLSGDGGGLDQAEATRDKPESRGFAIARRTSSGSAQSVLLARPIVALRRSSVRLSGDPFGNCEIPRSESVSARGRSALIAPAPGAAAGRLAPPQADESASKIAPPGLHRDRFTNSASAVPKRNFAPPCGCDAMHCGNPQLPARR